MTTSTQAPIKDLCLAGLISTLANSQDTGDLEMAILQNCLETAIEQLSGNTAALSEIAEAALGVVSSADVDLADIDCIDTVAQIGKFSNEPTDNQMIITCNKRVTMSADIECSYIVEKTDWNKALSEFDGSEEVILNSIKHDHAVCISRTVNEGEVFQVHETTIDSEQ